MSDDPKCVCGDPGRQGEAVSEHDWQPDPHGGGRFCPLCQAKETQMGESVCICGHRRTSSRPIDESDLGRE